MKVRKFLGGDVDNVLDLINLAFERTMEESDRYLKKYKFEEDGGMGIPPYERLPQVGWL